MSAPESTDDGSAVALVAELAKRGVVLRAEDGALVVSARRGLISPMERAALRALKPQLITLLTEPSARDAADAADLDLAPRGALVAPVLDHVELRRQVWQLARARSFSAITVRQYHQPAGADAWRTFCRTANLRWLETAAETLGAMVAPAGAASTEPDGRPTWWCACDYRCWSHVDQPQWYCSNCGRWARGPPGRGVCAVGRLVGVECKTGAGRLSFKQQLERDAILLVRRPSGQKEEMRYVEAE
jgi:hypothetical protein